MVKATQIALAAAVSAPLASAVTPTCAVTGQAFRDPNHEHGVNGGFQVDAWACQALCKTQPSCEKFTWFADKTACWLQGKDSVSYEEKDAISGAKDCGVKTVSVKALTVDAKAAADKAAAIPPVAAAQVAAEATVVADKAAAGAAKVSADTAAGAKKSAEKVAADAKAVADRATAEAQKIADGATAAAAKVAADLKAAKEAAAKVAQTKAAEEAAAGKVAGETVGAAVPKVAVPEVAAPDVSAAVAPEVPCAVAGKAYNDPKRDDSPNGGVLLSAAACQNKCKETVYCTHFTWYKDTNACWLQGSDLNVFDEKDAFSGPVNCAPVAAADAPPAPAADDTKTKKGGFPVWGWVLIGLGVAALAGGAAMFMMSSGGAKKKKRTVSAAPAGKVDEESLMSSKPVKPVKEPLMSSAPIASAASVTYTAVPQAQPTYTIQQAPSAVYVAAPVYTAAPAVTTTSYAVAPAQYVTTAQNAFDVLDRDGDGVLTREEMAAAGLR